MILQDAILQCADISSDATRCVTNARYKERREFIEVRGAQETLWLHSWALPTQGTAWCPTAHDLFTNTWEIFHPEQYNKDAQ